MNTRKRKNLLLLLQLQDRTDEFSYQPQQQKFESSSISTYIWESIKNLDIGSIGNSIERKVFNILFEIICQLTDTKLCADIFIFQIRFNYLRSHEMRKKRRLLFLRL